MITEKKTYYCKKCNRTLDSGNFYTSNNLEKYPDDGKMDICKQCLTMHVDNWEPETFKWILEEIDVPYIEEEWNILLARYGRDRRKVTGTTIMGRYLSKMKLKQYRDYRWKDTEYLQDLANHKIEEAMKRQGFSAAEIADAINRGQITVEKPAPLPEPEDPATLEPQNSIYEETLASDLTDEDIKYLSLKWGHSYKPAEWVRLEQLYEEMMESYDVQTAGHIDNLKLLCKTSLKSNQLLDLGDVDGAQKMLRMYDGLMKSGNFTAAQNKADSGEYVDSISELVAICEKDGFIPRYYTDGPQDKVDRTLQDIKNYTKSLVTEEMNLGNLIENAIKQIEEDKIKEQEGSSEAATDEELLELELFADSANTTVMTDTDYTEFEEFQDELEEQNNTLMQQLLDGEV